MNLTIKGNKKSDTNISGLVKQMGTLKCRLKVDITAGEILIENLDDSYVDKVIDCVDTAFDIMVLDLVPTEVKEEPPVVIPEIPQATPVTPNVTAEAIEFEKIQFSNDAVAEAVNKMMRTIYWAMYSSNANSSDICKFLISTTTEIAMKYNPKELIAFSVGDIVVCNYGHHLAGEISGGYVHSVVCDIGPTGMVYVLPITKFTEGITAEHYLTFNAEQDVKYFDWRYKGGTVLLDKGRSLRPERFHSVVGRVFPQFLEIIFEKLPAATSFNASDYQSSLAEKVGDVYNDDDMLEISDIPKTGEHLSLEAKGNEPEETGESNQGDSKQTEGEEPPAEAKGNEPQETGEDKKMGPFEKALFDVIGEQLRTLIKDKDVESQLDDFMDSIGLDKSARIVRQSFLAACKVKRISYESLFAEMYDVFPTIRSEIMKASLQEEWKNWLSTQPTLAEQHPKIPLTSLLKVFVKQVK